MNTRARPSYRELRTPLVSSFWSSFWCNCGICHLSSRCNMQTKLFVLLGIAATAAGFNFLSALQPFKLQHRHSFFPFVRSSSINPTSSTTLQATATLSGSSNAYQLSHPDQPPYEMNTQQNVYLFLSNWFVVCLIAADVIGVKIFNINVLGQEIHHTCGMISFPITFLLSDIINEYYGPAATKKTVYLGLIMSIFVFGVINVAQALPYLDRAFNVSQHSFDMIFGSAKVMYVASIIAYLLGQLTDIWMYTAIKRITKGRMLWLRAAVSTLVSQMLDSFVVSYVAYSLGKTLTGQIPATIAEVLNIAITGYGLKFAIAAAITPFLYLSRAFLQKKFGLLPLPIEAMVAEKKRGATTLWESDADESTVA